MAESRHWVKITRAFAIRPSQVMYAYLECFDPDFRTIGQTGPVTLRIGTEVIRMRHVGAGNVEGELALMLTVDDPRYKTVEEVRRRMGDVSDVFVARISEASD